MSSIGFGWSYCIICPPSESSALWFVLLYNITSLSFESDECFLLKSRLLLSQFLMNIRISLKRFFPACQELSSFTTKVGTDVGKKLVKLLRFIFFGTPYNSGSENNEVFVRLLIEESCLISHSRKIQSESLFFGQKKKLIKSVIKSMHGFHKSEVESLSNNLQ